MTSPNSAKAEAIVLSCIDYRFFPKYAELLATAGLKEHYDHIIFPGAELGALMCSKFRKQISKEPLTESFAEHWLETFEEQLDVAIKLHPRIDMLIIISHRECGAYGPKGFGLLPEHPELKEEEGVHVRCMRYLTSHIKSQPKYCKIRCFHLLLVPVPRTTEYSQLHLHIHSAQNPQAAVETQRVYTVSIAGQFRCNFREFGKS